MRETPLISIIIPTYNRAKIIGETLDSIMAQSYPNWECIIVDDGSTDNTEEVIANYTVKDSRFQYLTRPANRLKGPCSCRNYGFEHSNGAYINFFDSDDLLKPKALEEAFNAFNEDTDAVIMNSALTDLETGLHIGKNTILSSNLLTDYFVGNVTFLVCGPLWKRGFLDQQSYLFDEKISNIDDWDFNLRMLYQNPTLVFIDEILIYYRMHENSLSKEVRKMNKIEIASDFDARNKHLKLILKRSDIDMEIINRFILTRYKRYFRWAIDQDSDVKILTFLAKELVSKQVDFCDYRGAFRSSIGYIAVCLTGKGYSFFKD